MPDQQEDEWEENPELTTYVSQVLQAKAASIRVEAPFEIGLTVAALLTAVKVFFDPLPDQIPELIQVGAVLSPIAIGLIGSLRSHIHKKSLLAQADYYKKKANEAFDPARPRN